MAVTILVGDARAVLATLPEKSVQLCVTSPPYFGLRSYSTSPQVWGGDQSGACAHEWGDTNHRHFEQGNKRKPSDDGIAGRNRANDKAAPVLVETSGAHCLRCGCWRGELGSEPSPEAFIANLVEVFAAVRRVLRDDGTMWVNLGDSYAGSGKGPTGHNGIGDQETRQGFTTATNHDYSTANPVPGFRSGRYLERPGRNPATPGYKAKDLMMMPARVALALQQEGWILRSCMPWIKASAMPESVQDRPSSALEYVFLFSKKARYFYDAEAVRQTASDQVGRVGAIGRANGATSTGARARAMGREPSGNEKEGATWTYTASRSFRNTDLFRIALAAHIVALRAEVARLEAQRDAGGLLLDEDGDPLALDVNPAAFKDAHFATFPEKLVLPLIRAGTSERGACPTCGAAWVRVVERGDITPLRGDSTVGPKYRNQPLDGVESKMAHYERDGWTPGVREASTTGWRQSCPCPPAEPIPQICLDPFSGAGTTGLVASRLGRDYIGIELSPVYAAMSEARIRDDAPLLVDVVTTGAVEYAPLELFGERPT